jgi:DNA-binding SARP family transcriptional activator
MVVMAVEHAVWELVKRCRYVVVGMHGLMVDGGTVLIRLLGAVEVVTDSGQTVELGPPQRCAVLAALAVDAGRSVPVDVLLDRVWGTAMPQKARRALQAHIVHLRRRLRSCAGGGSEAVDVVRRSGGYALTVDRDQVDLHRFRDLVARARLTDIITDRGR